MTLPLQFQIYHFYIRLGFVVAFSVASYNCVNQTFNSAIKIFAFDLTLISFLTCCRDFYVELDVNSSFPLDCQSKRHYQNFPF